VFGAGQIGSRHAQALARSERIERVEVLGRSARSLQIAEERYRQVAPSRRQSALFTDDWSRLSAAIDVAIVATNSDTRFDVVSRLLREKRVRALILEKVVFQSATEFESALAELARHSIPAWVNCWRRALPVYRDLRLHDINMSVHGGEWGLGCNAVHYVDLCAFLGGSDDVRVQAELDTEIQPGRRAGFSEFTGRISGTCGPHRFELVAQRGSAEPETMRIGTTVEERGQSVTVGGAAPVTMPYQSELTHKLVEEILERGASSLPTLAESYRIHKPLLELFTKHLERTTGRSYPRCPIT